MQEECRFCNLQTDKKKPKMNNLTAQLIQYHYLDEFYFYFSKPINEVLTDTRSPESIMYKDCAFDIHSPDELLAYEGQGALVKIAELAREQEIRPYELNYNFLDCWKVFADRKYYRRRVHRMQRSGMNPGRKKRGPQFPLRSSNILQNLNKACSDSINSSFETKLHDIYEPEYSSQMDSLQVSIDFGDSGLYHSVSRLELKGLLQSDSQIESLAVSRIERKPSLSTLRVENHPVFGRQDRKERPAVNSLAPIHNLEISSSSKTNPNVMMVMPNENSGIKRKVKREHSHKKMATTTTTGPSSKRQNQSRSKQKAGKENLFKKKNRGQLILIKNEYDSKNHFNHGYLTDRRAPRGRSKHPESQARKAGKLGLKGVGTGPLVGLEIGSARGARGKTRLFKESSIQGLHRKTSSKKFKAKRKKKQQPKVSSDNMSTNFSSQAGSKPAFKRRRKEKINLGISKKVKERSIDSSMVAGSGPQIKYTISPQKAKRLRNTQTNSSMQQRYGQQENTAGSSLRPSKTIEGTILDNNNKPLIFSMSIKEWQKLGSVPSSNKKRSPKIIQQQLLEGKGQNRALKISSLLARSWEPKPNKKNGKNTAISGVVGGMGSNNLQISSKNEQMFESLRKNKTSFKEGGKKSLISPMPKKPQTARGAIIGSSSGKEQYLSKRARTFINQIKRERKLSRRKGGSKKAKGGKKQQQSPRNFGLTGSSNYNSSNTLTSQSKSASSKRGIWHRALYSRDNLMYKSRKMETPLQKKGLKTHLMFDLKPEFFKTTGNFKKPMKGAPKSVKQTFQKKFSFKTDRTRNVDPNELFMPKSTYRSRQTSSRGKTASLVRYLRKMESKPDLGDNCNLQEFLSSAKQSFGTATTGTISKKKSFVNPRGKQSPASSQQLQNPQFLVKGAATKTSQASFGSPLSKLHKNHNQAPLEGQSLHKNISRRRRDLKPKKSSPISKLGRASGALRKLQGGTPFIRNWM